MRYYHGGAPGLRGKLLPPDETGAPSLSAYDSRQFCRMDRVYLTTDPHAALIYAASHPSGTGVVYEVEPIGEVEPDPDCNEPGLSFMAPAARIIRKTRVSPATRRKVLRTLARDAA